MTFCPLPWIHQSIKSDGSYRVCCHANSSFNRGVLSKDGVVLSFQSKTDDVVNSDQLKELRLKMLSNQKHEYCQRCYNEEDAGMQSRRQYEIEMWNADIESYRINTNLDGSLTEYQTKFYDIRFGNFCNLKCRMCGPTDSNQWYSDYIDVYNSWEYDDNSNKIKINPDRKTVENDPYQWFKSKDYWKNFKNPERIFMAGGEPLLIEEHWEFLRKCIREKSSKQIDLEYNTNLSNFTMEHVDIWKNFKSVSLNISIDGYGPYHRYIRYPSNWKNIEKNLDQIEQTSKQHPNIKICISFTLMIYNSFHVVDFYNWFYLKNYTKLNRWGGTKCGFSVHMVHRPHWLSLKNLPPNKKKEVEEYWNMRLKDINETHQIDFVKLQTQFEKFKKFMWSDQYSLWDEYMEKTKKLDTLRNQNIIDLDLRLV